LFKVCVASISRAENKDRTRSHTLFTHFSVRCCAYILCVSVLKKQLCLSASYAVANVPTYN